MISWNAGNSTKRVLPCVLSMSGVMWCCCSCESEASIGLFLSVFVPFCRCLSVRKSTYEKLVTMYPDAVRASAGKLHVTPSLAANQFVSHSHWYVAVSERGPAYTMIATNHDGHKPWWPQSIPWRPQQWKREKSNGIVVRHRQSGVVLPQLWEWGIYWSISWPWFVAIVRQISPSYVMVYGRHGCGHHGHCSWPSWFVAGIVESQWKPFWYTGSCCGCCCILYTRKHGPHCLCP